MSGPGFSLTVRKQKDEQGRPTVSLTADPSRHRLVVSGPVNALDYTVCQLEIGRHDRGVIVSDDRVAIRLTLDVLCAFSELARTYALTYPSTDACNSEAFLLSIQKIAEETSDG